ncbi:MAG: hypothetical protein U0992_15895 [Planctomycetaceae bacterium]
MDRRSGFHRRRPDRRAQPSIRPRPVRGHYPAFPVLPGVLQIEAALRAGAADRTGRRRRPDAVPVVTRLNNDQFRQLVRPGDVLEIEVELSERLGGVFPQGQDGGRRPGRRRLEFACTLTPPPAG